MQHIEEARHTVATAAQSRLNVVGASLKLELWTIEKIEQQALKTPTEVKS